MKPVLFDEAADLEMREAALFYENRSSGLGKEFTSAVESAVRQIQEAPHRWPRRTRSTRRFLLVNFPYSVVYLDQPGQIWIVAVAHASRNPRYWLSRLQ